MIMHRIIKSANTRHNESQETNSKSLSSDEGELTESDNEEDDKHSVTLPLASTRAPNRTDLWSNVLVQRSIDELTTEITKIASEAPVMVDRAAESYPVPDCSRQNTRCTRSQHEHAALDQALEMYTQNKQSEECPFEGQVAEVDRVEQNVHSKYKTTRKRPKCDNDFAERKKRNTPKLQVDRKRSKLTGHLPRILHGNHGTRSHEQLVKELSAALQEDNLVLLARSVEHLGARLVCDLYEKTRLIECEGGQLTANGERRRTAGGVFCQLIQKDESVTKLQREQIFAEERVRNKQMARERRKLQRQGAPKTDIAKQVQQLGSEVAKAKSASFSAQKKQPSKGDCTDLRTKLKPTSSTTDADKNEVFDIETFEDDIIAQADLLMAEMMKE